MANLRDRMSRSLPVKMELFRPDNLSRLKPEFVVIDDQDLRTTIAALLVTVYQLRDVSSLVLSRTSGANVMSDNFLVDLPQSRYFLKRREFARHESLKNEATWAVTLHRLGVKVPRVSPTTDNEVVGSDENSCFVLYSFEEGQYFTGRDRELDEAGAAFVSLTDAALKISIQQEQTTTFGNFFDELPSLLSEAVARNDSNSSSLCGIHRERILRSLALVKDERLRIESQTLPMHLDYHPLNLLMRDSKVACILDFEHVQTYPVRAALGFAGYKLIRQAMVIDEIRERELSDPKLFPQWLSEWNRAFPSMTFTPLEVGMGARYQVLHLIWLILHSWLVNADRRLNYDLEKQIRSLYELDVMMEGY